MVAQVEFGLKESSSSRCGIRGPISGRQSDPVESTLSANFRHQTWQIGAAGSAHNGISWRAMMRDSLAGQVARLNQKTDEIVEYLLPWCLSTKKNRPVLWFGINHGTAIVRVVPLD